MFITGLSVCMSVSTHYCVNKDYHKRAVRFFDCTEMKREDLQRTLVVKSVKVEDLSAVTKLLQNQLCKKASVAFVRDKKQALHGFVALLSEFRHPGTYPKKRWVFFGYTQLKKTHPKKTHTSTLT